MTTLELEQKKAREVFLANYLDGAKEGEAGASMIDASEVLKALDEAVASAFAAGERAERERIKIITESIQTNDGTIRAVVEYTKSLVLAAINKTP